MNANEIRALSSDEMRQKLLALKHELFNLRFQKSIGQLENPRKIKQTRKDIARIETVLTEITRNSQETDN